jgi:hypothetical protein
MELVMTLPAASSSGFIRESLRNFVLFLTGFTALTAFCQDLRFAEPFGNPDGSFKVKLLTAQGQSCTVEISTNLTTWEANYCYTNGADEITLIDPPGSDGNGRRFYRARLGTAVVSRFSFGFSGYGGAWRQRWVAYPLSVDASARFVIERAQDYPPPDQVLFSGPVGSGFSNSPAVALSGWEYESKKESQGLPVIGGQWKVQFHGTNFNFDVADPNIASRLVIPFPDVTEGSDGVMVSWTYLNATSGAPLARPPAFLTSVQVAIAEVRSGVLPPETTKYVFPSLILPRDATVVINYGDTLGNGYSVRFSELQP